MLDFILLMFFCGEEDRSLFFGFRQQCPFFPLPLPAACEGFRSSLDVDLFWNKTRCIHVHPSDVAAVIVLPKSGSDTILTHNEEAELKYGGRVDLN